jgi:acetolactate synthase-1/2/3 large subunit
MIAAVEGAPGRRAEWLEQVRGYVADYWAESEPHRQSEALPMRPERLCRELEEWLPADATLVVDTFHAAIWTAQMMRMKRGQRYLRCGGSLGWGFPAAIGVKAALGDKPVIGFAGDAGFYYHLAELETAARAGLDLVMVVNNNFAGGVKEKSDFLKTVNFARTAESLGCAGFRVERPADIAGALDKALAAGRPAVVEIITDAAVRAKAGWVSAGS